MQNGSLNKCKFLGLISLQVPRPKNIIIIITAAKVIRKKNIKLEWPGKYLRHRKHMKQRLPQGSDLALPSSPAHPPRVLHLTSWLL